MVQGCGLFDAPPPEPKARNFIDVPDFVSMLPGRWVIDSPVPVTDTEIRFVRREGVRTVELSGGEVPYILAQDVTANLFLTPYLRWLWHFDDPGNLEHPVSLIIGYTSGNPLPKGQAGSASIGNLADYDRLILIGFGSSPLQRGSFFPASDKGTVARYILRGGPEHSGKWWPETVDLAKLYRRGWPADNFNNVRISFIGIAVEGAKGPHAARFSAIELMK